MPQESQAYDQRHKAIYRSDPLLQVSALPPLGILSDFSNAQSGIH